MLQTTPPPTNGPPDADALPFPMPAPSSESVQVALQEASGPGVVVNLATKTAPSEKAPTSSAAPREKAKAQRPPKGSNKGRGVLRLPSGYRGH